MFRKLTICLALAAVAVYGQSKLSFEVATVKPAAPLDMAKLAAALQSGGKMPIGQTLSGERAEYTYVDLKTLIAYAYKVRPFQVSGPDWLGTTRFDIVAKYPAGATKDDVPQMLQTLLEERFKLAVHRTDAEHPVLALVAGKGGTKLKASEKEPVAIDDDAPLKPGERKVDGPDGPIRISGNPAGGSMVIDMGLQGKMTYKIDPATQTFHIDMSMVTLKGFADMTTQLLTMLGGGQLDRQIVDMTGIQGHYEASLDLSMADLMALAQARGIEVPPGAGGQSAPAGGATGAAGSVATDPGLGGARSLSEAVQALGLKLESRRAPVEQLVVDRVEKTPTEN